MTPYCNHPDCHDTRTASYWRSGNTNLGAPQTGIRSTPELILGVDRLCRIHALQKYKFAAWT